MKVEQKGFIPDIPDRSIIDEIFRRSVQEIERGSERGRVSGGRSSIGRVDGEGFLSDFMKALEVVKDAQEEAKRMSIKMVLGEVEDIHDVMISRQKAETLFQLFIEFRNRAVQAFENIMRMQF